MGEYADMIIEGLVDAETGEIIDGEAPGYPRTAGDDFARRNRRKPKQRGGPVKCPTCDAGFQTRQARDQHWRDKHEPKAVRREQETQRRHEHLKPWLCGVCGKRFRKKVALWQHERDSHGGTTE